MRRSVINNLSSVLRRGSFALASSRSTVSRATIARSALPPIQAAAPLRPYSTTRTSQTPRKQCPTCSTPLPPSTLLCTSCSSLTPLPSSTTHYDLFGLSPPPEGPFDVDGRALRQKFLKMQQLVHPDSFVNKEEGQRRLADTLSSHLNNAYRTLLTPLPRATYLLSTYHDIHTDADTPPPETHTPDPAILMTVLEVREAIEEARTEEEIEEIKRENEERIEETVEEIGRALEGGDIEEATRAAYRLRYWNGIKSAVDEWEPGKMVKMDH
ncbi:Co-chaperone Hsc20 [Saitoella complicata NRRL Y-17804]|nr:Co-chaperone Hsc20 [Saitoella complicata NRRL Y-17804]ODQ55312.1 Co-chaperone Hsc20 [Saitoella complicata NRRL Y-17804]